MASRKIEGTKHIRRRLRTRAKVAIGVVALAAMSLGGLFFINTTDKGAEVKGKIAQMSIVSGTHEADQSYGGGSTPSSKVESIIRITGRPMITTTTSVTDAKTAGGGYISGSGTLKSGEHLTLKATPFPGYVFFKWAFREGSGVWEEISEYTEISVVNGYDGDYSVKTTNNKELVAVFKKEGTTDYTYDFSISPAVGTLNSVYCSGDNMTLYPENTNYEISSSNPSRSFVMVWRLQYSDLERNFTYDTESHSGGKTTTSDDSKTSTTDNDTYTTYKTYNIEYDVYGYNEDGLKIFDKKDNAVRCKIAVDRGGGKIDPVDIECYPQFSDDDAANVKGRYYWVIVPHTMSGARYQAITVADPKEGGTTNGDRASSTPFSTTLSAVAAEGYKFDRWTWIDNLGDTLDVDDASAVNIYREMESKEKSPNVTPNGTVIYTAHFVPETYNIDIESISPEEGGSIQGLGDYKAHTDIPIIISPSDGYKLDSWTYTTSDGDSYSGNSENFTIKDLSSDIKLSVKFTSTKARIDVKASPVDGGSVTVENTSASGEPKTDYEEFIIGKQKAKLVAKPADYHTFLYWKDSKGNIYNGETQDDRSNVLTLNKVASSDTFTAYFAPVNITIKTNVYPDATAGSVEVTGATVVNSNEYSAAPNTSVTLKAVEATGYHFQKFVDDSGKEYQSNPLVKSDLVTDTTFTAIFVPDEITISVEATPVIGGRAEISVNDGPAREGSNTVAYNDKVKIIAIPNAGYAFKYFEDKNGSKYAGSVAADGSASFEFNAVNGSETYKAVFAMSQVTVSVKVDPNTTNSSDGKYVAGKFKVNYTYTDESGKDQNITKEGDAPGFEITNIKGQTSVKITAVELGGYKFSKFIDSEGNSWTENPMVLGDLVENKDIEVIFVKEHWRIDVQSSPESGGRVTVNGVESGVDVDYGDHVKIEAKPNDGYTFKYFKDALGNEFLSNPLEFDAINGSEKYTAYFAKNDVSITIDLAPEGSGTVRFNSQPAVSKRTTYSTEGKSSVVLTATPKEDVKFLYWRDQDGNTYGDNPLTLTDISRDLIFTAIFDTKFDTIRAIASPPSGGKITKIINDDGSITLIAKANRGYRFTSWKKPNGRTFAYKFTIPADQVHSGDVYTAFFKAIAGYKHESDITKESFYREWRRVVTPNYTVTRDSMRLLAAQTVAGLRQYDDATPELKGYGAIANARAYFDERVAKDIERLDGVFGDSELMTAEGEILTPDLLPDDVKYSKQADEFTNKKFGDRYDTELLTVKRIIEPEGFDNDKRTYLWRYTGAEYKDNIYLLYNINGSKHEWATPIVDEDGVLKFTIDELRDNDVVAVVRVKIK